MRRQLACMRVCLFGFCYDRHSAPACLDDVQECGGCSGHPWVALSALFDLEPPRDSFPRILWHAGQTSLAYVTAATHGLVEDAERLGEQLGELRPRVDAAHGKPS